VSSGPVRDSDAKEQVKRAIDIVDLVGGYIQLRREGRAFKGLCPWHQDSRPSLHINQERQSWKCWVCNVGGDVFDFVMKQEGVEFREALAMLAERAGIALRPRAAGQGGPSVDQKTLLFQAAAWAEEQYHECLLRAPEAEPARRYVAERGITDDSVKRFHLGFAPESWDWLLKRSHATKFTPAILEAIDLVVRRPNGPGHYDRFRGRVLFPIRDSQGRPVALGGRILPGAPLREGDTPPAKYINSRETPLFSKSSLLYGLDKARDAITKSRTAIVMEGYTDCLIAQQCGFRDAVAVLGTALGERHVKLLRPLADRVVLMLDGDQAGKNRTNEVLELFLAENVELLVATPPAGLDPCDFLLGNDPDDFRKLIDNAADALTHAFHTFTDGIDRDDIHQMGQALDKLLAIIAKAPRLRADTTTAARLREQKTLERLAFLFRIPELDVRARLTDLRRKGTWKSASEGDAPAEVIAIGLWERQLLELILQLPDHVPRVLDIVRPSDLSSPACRAILERCQDLREADVPADFDRLMLEFDDPRIKNLIVEFDEGARDKSPADPLGHLEQVLDSFRRRREDRRRHAQTQSLRQPNMSENDQQRILKELLEKKRNRLGISLPTEG
jgi:DNA primase